MSLSQTYILDENGNPVPSNDYEKISETFSNDEKRTVAKDDFNIDDNEVRVSTVFLVIDHYMGIEENHTPVLYETMIFGGKHDQYQERYTTREMALQGHNKAVQMAKGE